MLDTLWHDLRLGVRLLIKHPGFAAVAVLSIAFGVAATAAMFSVTDGLVLRPLPVPRAGEIVTINATTPVDQGRGTGLSYPDYRDLRAQNHSFTGLAAHRVVITTFARRREDQTQSRLGYAVSGDLFQVMDVQPALGRFFTEDEGWVQGHDPVVVLAHDTWAREFQSAFDIVGRPVRLGGVTFSVIGVAPESFTGLELVLPGAFYVPLPALPLLDPQPQGSLSQSGPSQGGLPQGSLLDRRDVRMLTVRGRLKDGVSLAQARADVRQVGLDLQRAYPSTNQRQDLLVRTHLEARRIERGPAAVGVAMLLTLAVLVLLVACANVAGLLMSRAPARAREMAIRHAIGAGRSRLVRQLVTEAMLLAVAGGALGVSLAYVGIGLLGGMQVISDIGVRIRFDTDARVLVFATGLAAVCTVVAGLIPAWKSARLQDLANTLRQVATADAGHTRLWGRKALVVGQVALSLALVAAAVFLYRTFGDELARGPGFRTDHVLLVNLDPGLARYETQRANDTYERLKARVRGLPGVTAVGLASTMPMNQDHRDFVAVAPEGYQLPSGVERLFTQVSRIDEGLFDVLGLRMVAGRGVRRTDTADAPLVAVVNETAAAHYWPGQSALGKRLRMGDSWVDVVGVAADSKYNFITEAPSEFLYLPRLQNPSTRSTLVVATAGPTQAIAGPVQAAVQAIDRELPVTGVWTMEEYYDGNAVGLSRMATRTVGTMGFIGLGLALVGLYGLVAYAVSRRTREIGLRMAIGADPASVLGMVMRQGLTLSVTGAGIGIALMFGTSGVLQAIFPSSHGFDVAIYLAVVPALLAVTSLAAYLPARRASRIDPLAALRQE